MSKKHRNEPKKDRRMKIMWSSNAPWAPSGYGVQTRDLLYRFITDGWQTACSCFYGLEGGFLNLGGLACYPKIGEPYGGDALLLHSREFGADVAFTFQDIWPVNATNLFSMAAERRWIPYLPVDWYPVPENIVQRVSHAYRVVTISKFGQKALLEKGVQSELILEGTDIDIFKPMNRSEIRKELGIPDDIFLFGMVAANKDNPPRKCFQHCMDAFMMFLKNHPKSALYFQTLLEQDGGFNIVQYAKHLGILDKVFFPPPYQYLYKSPHPIVAKIYNTFDVLLNPSNSEGFGLPIIEAQACGIPVITNDWASMPELIIPEKTGLLTKRGYSVWSPNGAYKTEPDVDSIHECMEKLFVADRKQMAIDCRKFIVDNYDINVRVRDSWIPFLEKIQHEILDNKINIVKTR